MKATTAHRKPSPAQPGKPLDTQPPSPTASAARPPTDLLTLLARRRFLQLSWLKHVSPFFFFLEGVSPFSQIMYFILFYFFSSISKRKKRGTGIQRTLFVKNIYLFHLKNKAFLYLVLLQCKFLNKTKFSLGNNTFFLVAIKAYFILSTPTNNIGMKNILWSRKGSQPPQSMPCEGREATRASSLEEV